MFSDALVGVLLVKIRGVFHAHWGGWELTQRGSVQFFNMSLHFNNLTLNTYVKKYCLKSCCLLKPSLSPVKLCQLMKLWS